MIPWGNLTRHVSSTVHARSICMPHPDKVLLHNLPDAQRDIDLQMQVTYEDISRVKFSPDLPDPLLSLQDAPNRTEQTSSLYVTECFLRQQFPG